MNEYNSIEYKSKKIFFFFIINREEWHERVSFEKRDKYDIKGNK